MATLQPSASARWSPILKMLRPHARKARAGTCAWGCAGATAQHWPRSAWLHLLLCCEAWRLGDLVYGIGREGVSMARLCCGVGQPSRPLRPIRSECRKYELSVCLSLEQSRAQSSIPSMYASGKTSVARWRQASKSEQRLTRATVPELGSSPESREKVR